MTDKQPIDAQPADIPAVSTSEKSTALTPIKVLSVKKIVEGIVDNSLTKTDAVTAINDHVSHRVQLALQQRDAAHRQHIINIQAQMRKEIAASITKDFAERMRALVLKYTATTSKADADEELDTHDERDKSNDVPSSTATSSHADTPPAATSAATSSALVSVGPQPTAQTSSHEQYEEAATVKKSTVPVSFQTPQPNIDILNPDGSMQGARLFSGAVTATTTKIVHEVSPFANLQASLFTTMKPSISFSKPEAQEGVATKTPECFPVSTTGKEIIQPARLNPGKAPGTQRMAKMSTSQRRFPFRVQNQEDLRAATPSSDESAHDVSSFVHESDIRMDNAELDDEGENDGTTD